MDPAIRCNSPHVSARDAFAYVSQAAVGKIRKRLVTQHFNDVHDDGQKRKYARLLSEMTPVDVSREFAVQVRLCDRTKLVLLAAEAQARASRAWP